MKFLSYTVTETKILNNNYNRPAHIKLYIKYDTIYLFSDDLLSVCYVPRTVSGARNTVVDKIVKK